jgi:NADH-quinone oxidoreductase E subunit
MDTKLQELLEKYSHATRDSLIPILQEIQDEMGYLSEEAINAVGLHLDVATSKIFGLATFYNQFRFQPKGKNHLRFCHGTSCHIMGAENLIQQVEKKLRISPGQTSRDGNFSLEVVSCVGACAHSPVITLNGKHQGYMSPEKLDELVDDLSDKE